MKIICGKCRNTGEYIYTLVDADKYTFLNNFKWRCGGKPPNTYVYRYATSFGKQIRIMLHRVVIEAPAGKYVEHINRNTLDNRLSNLRLCNKKQNAHNKANTGTSKSQYKGVCPLPNGKYSARITIQGEPRYLGCFDREIDAALAYDKAARRYFKEFAATNVSLLRSTTAFGKIIKK